MAVLKKQLEEREKKLATEQEDASAAKARLRELTKVSCCRCCPIPVTRSMSLQEPSSREADLTTINKLEIKI